MKKTQDHKKNATSLISELAEARNGRQSNVYRFMLDHHDELMEALGTSNIKWPTVCTFLAKNRITNADGKIPSPDRIRKIWYAVRKAVQKQREAEAEETTIKEQKAQERREAREREKQEEREGLRRFNFLVERQEERKPEHPKPAASISNASQVNEDHYTGPRPLGLPDDIPLEHLTPLTATGLTSDGKDYDFENMPGYPRCRFFRWKNEWAVICWKMGQAKPREQWSELENDFMMYLSVFPGTLRP